MEILSLSLFKPPLHILHFFFLRVFIFSFHFILLLLKSANPLITLLLRTVHSCLSRFEWGSGFTAGGQPQKLSGEAKGRSGRAAAPLGTNTQLRLVVEFGPREKKTSQQVALPVKYQVVPKGTRNFCSSVCPFVPGFLLLLIWQALVYPLALDTDLVGESHSSAVDVHQN